MMTTAHTGHARVARRGFETWSALLGVLVALAFGTWIYQLTQGLRVTGMRDIVSWGAYIVTFAFFVGLSAGGLIVASAAEVFGVQSLKPLSKLGVLTALASVTCAGLMIIPDLGRPDRILNLVAHPHWVSPLIWDVGIIAVYFVFAAVDLTVLHRRDKAPTGMAKTVRALAYIGLPTAVLLHSITAWIFGLQIARTWWNTALMAPLFVTSAILSGTALVAVAAAAAQWFAHAKVPQQTWRVVTNLLVVSLCVDLFLVACDYITILWGNVPRERAALDLILPGGSWQSVFWLEWVVGGAVPLVLLMTPRLRASRALIVVAALLAMVGVYAYRIELVVGGLVRPIMQLPPGIAKGSYQGDKASFVYTGTYHPTWVEISIVVGMFALLATFITIGYRRLKVLSRPPEIPPSRGAEAALPMPEVPEAAEVAEVHEAHGAMA
jgi:molybdopterin-containing oxidoreductase family membrane subunit